MNAHAKDAADRKAAFMPESRSGRARTQRVARGSLAIVNAAFAAALTLSPLAAAADPAAVRGETGAAVAAPGQVRVAAGARAAVRFSPRPRFYPYYYPYCPHQYWHFLYGAPVPNGRGCGVETEVSAEVVEDSPDLPRVGLGAFGGSVAAREGEAVPEIGLIGRLRPWDHLQVEIELSRTDRDDEAGSDDRLGGALILEIMPYRAVSPYLLAGAGFGRAELDDGDFAADQAYGEVGLGLEWAVVRPFSLFGDARIGLRSKGDGDDEPALRARSPDGEMDEDERFGRVRVGALLYF